MLKPLILAAGLGLAGLGLASCASTGAQDEVQAPMPLAVEQACGNYRAMMTAPLPPAQMAKLRMECEEAMKADGS